ncbi:hypothetical protein [Bifidobacterium samirii]|uniref:hypothetical protein n=1 Tax=Bifidobacterium samirii TaxID=2306974 RepID=UPI000F7DDD84|nr:hypothetical protein [Bifidobacterium samirii]
MSDDMPSIHESGRCMTFAVTADGPSGVPTMGLIAVEADGGAPVIVPPVVGFDASDDTGRITVLEPRPSRVLTIMTVGACRMTMRHIPEPAQPSPAADIRLPKDEARKMAPSSCRRHPYSSCIIAAALNPAKTRPGRCRARVRMIWRVRSAGSRDSQYPASAYMPRCGRTRIPAFTRVTTACRWALVSGTKQRR